jgi:hypothetical protein
MEAFHAGVADLECVNHAYVVLLPKAPEVQMP